MRKAPGRKRRDLSLSRLAEPTGAYRVFASFRGEKRLGAGVNHRSVQRLPAARLLIDTHCPCEWLEPDDAKADTQSDCSGGASGPTSSPGRKTTSGSPSFRARTPG